MVAGGDGLLMVRFKDYENLIYGVSWWLALLGIAWAIRRPVREDRGQRSSPSIAS